MMYRVETEHDRCDAFGQELVCMLAHEQAMKHHVYQLRAQALSTTRDERGATRHIDEYDKNAQHLLFSDASSGVHFASARLLAPPQCESASLATHVCNSGQLCELNAISLLGCEEPVFSQLSVCLAGYALGRLKFHDWLVFEVSPAMYRAFEVLGWSLHYAGESLYYRDEYIAVVADLNSDIRPDAPCYGLSQSITNTIAPQLNTPIWSEQA